MEKYNLNEGLGKKLTTEDGFTYIREDVVEDRLNEIMTNLKAQAKEILGLGSSNENAPSVPKKKKRFEGNNVRIVEKEGNPWFVAKDICGVLGVGNSRMALDRLNGNQKGVSSIDTLGGSQKMSVINEQGLCKLAFTSRKPEAERFTDWVAEVIETVRKTGGYVDDSQKMVDTYFGNVPDGQRQAIKAMFDNIADLQPEAEVTYRLHRKEVC